MQSKEIAAFMERRGMNNPRRSRSTSRRRSLLWMMFVLSKLQLVGWRRDLEQGSQPVRSPAKAAPQNSFQKTDAARPMAEHSPPKEYPRTFAATSELLPLIPTPLSGSVVHEDRKEGCARNHHTKQNRQPHHQEPKRGDELPQLCFSS